MKAIFKRRGLTSVAVRIDKESCSRSTYEIVNCKSDETSRSFWVLPWPIENIKQRVESDEFRVAYLGAAKNMSQFFSSATWIKYISDRNIKWLVKAAPEEWNDYSDVDVAICLRPVPSGKKPPTKLINAWCAGTIPIIGDRSGVELGTHGVDCFVAAPTDVPSILDTLIQEKEKMEFVLRGSRASGKRYGFDFVRRQWEAAIGRMG